jgi:hypothetical protein
MGSTLQQGCTEHGPAARHNTCLPFMHLNNSRAGRPLVGLGIPLHSPGPGLHARVPRRQGRRFGAAALRCVARIAAAAPDWGVIFFGYDWFAAYSAAAAATVAWDVLIPHYKVRLESRRLVRFRA